MLEVIFVIFLSGYFIQSVLFTIGLSKKYKTLKEEELPSATVIVAARNEEKNILDCLKSLNNLEYPEGKLEIIIVDDKSTDRTSEIVDEYIKDKPRFKKIITKKEIGQLIGKTNALANALEIATGEIILTTDADCTVKHSWVRGIAKHFVDGVAIVNGFTTQDAYDNFSGMQAIDFIYLLIAASGTTNLNQPISCIGNNMAYLRKAYLEVGGYESIPFSITEDFNLLYAIYKLNKYKIIFPFNPESLVTSKPCDDFKTIYRQKKRWGIGGLGVPFRGFVVMAFGFISNLAVLLTPFIFTPQWILLSVFKIMLDYFVLYPVHERLGIKKNMKYFLAFELYYLIYVVVLPFIVLPNPKVVWKGRQY